MKVFVMKKLSCNSVFFWLSVAVTVILSWKFESAKKDPAESFVVWVALVACLNASAFCCFCYLFFGLYFLAIYLHGVV
ncbi:hypothetical protein QVD17_38652 [Tagetes erecta]|uniref:Uncharacterized protein n=1 Tax=Tagetes erecta TaxID=13708 RepID=A0AAD8NFJ3_TARER|nr:hypothetical protein QVD17_38652 [Tagetes erecta]